MFIAFEGIDGSGKTTLSKIIAKKLSAWWTKEPTDVFVKLMRDNPECETNPKCEARYFIIDREKHIPNILDHMLLHNHVVSDRYYLSTFAYSGAKGVPLEWLKKNAVPNLVPSYVFLLTVPISVALERTTKRGEHENPDFLRAVQENYIMLSHALNDV